jgi:hypothetical protein
MRAVHWLRNLRQVSVGCSQAWGEGPEDGAFVIHCRYPCGRQEPVMQFADGNKDRQEICRD